MLLIKYSDDDFAMKPSTVEQLPHVTHEFLRHQDANRIVDYRNTKPKYNAEARKPSLSVTAPQQTVAPATGENQPWQEARPAESKPVVAEESKRTLYPNLRKPIEEIVCYFCGKKGHIVRDCPAHRNALLAFGVPPEVMQDLAAASGRSSPR